MVIALQVGLRMVVIVINFILIPVSTHRGSMQETLAVKADIQVNSET
jgi:hypothetical protein